MNALVVELKQSKTHHLTSYESVKTRFAPSPTGYLHIGSARTALFSYLFAKRHKGSFVLRIEDTDRERLVPDSLDDIKESLLWLGISWDEEPIIQSERIEIYKKYAKELVENRGAYYCFCDTERLESLRKDQLNKKIPPMYDGKCRDLTKEEIEKKIKDGHRFVIRQKVPKEGIVVIDDLIKGNIKFENKLLDDSVLLKSDSYPTYHLANVIDDHLTGITHVIRAEEWLPSTLKHILLYKTFGWDMPKFAHLPMVLGPDKSKLSKRHSATSVKDYRERGYLPEAIINFISFLGWNPGTKEEIFSMEELIKQFNLDRVGKAAAIFNIERLDWMNGYYIRHLDNDKLANLAIPYLQKAGLITEEVSFNYDYIKKVVTTEQERIKKLSELPLLVDFFFKDKLDYEPKLLGWKDTILDDIKLNLEMLKEYLNSLDEREFNKDILEDKIKKWIQKMAEQERISVLTKNDEAQIGDSKGKSVGDFLWPMRVALSGKDKSPGPFEIAEVLGKEMVLKRIQDGIKKLS